LFNTRALLGLLGLSLWAGVAADQNDPALDQLFLQLAHTGVKQESDRISAEIWERWARIDNAKASAWLERGIRAMSNQHYREALRSFNEVIDIAPAFAEGWNKRATLFYLAGKHDRSIDDIKQTLALEPRHFGALSGLGLILVAQDNFSGALIAFRKALVLNPHLIRIKRYVDRLEERQLKLDEENAI
jgi:tetratricopeptide (TPR) repeat protein